MTPTILALVSGGVFIVGLVATIWNMLTFTGDMMHGVTDAFMGDFVQKSAKRVVLHLVCGVFTSAGAIGLVASLVWYIALNVTAK